MKQELKQLSVRTIIVAIIASVYAALTIAVGSLGYSFIQIRIGEALTPLPFSMGFSAVAGLTIGCVIANFSSPIGIVDLIFGSLLTLLAALMSWKLSFNRKILACIYPVLINAFGVSLYVSIFYGVPYLVSVLTILISESIAAILIGYPLLVSIDRFIRRSSNGKQ